MRTLEKGFGKFSLRSSTIICLVALVVLSVLIVLALFLGTVDSSFVGTIITLVYQAFLSAVYGYTLFKLHHDDSSLVSTSLIVLCVDVVVSVLGIIGSIFVHLFSLIISLFFVLPYLVFRVYSIWVLYSYTIEINQPVTVNA